MDNNRYGAIGCYDEDEDEGYSMGGGGSPVRPVFVIENPVENLAGTVLVDESGEFITDESGFPIEDGF